MDTTLYIEHILYAFENMRFANKPKFFLAISLKSFLRKLIQEAYTRTIVWTSNVSNNNFVDVIVYVPFH